MDGSKSLNSLDITLMRRLILGITNTFPAGLWRFVPADYAFPNPQEPFDAPTNRCYTMLSTDLTNEDFAAVRIGDVNHSWAPADAALSPTETTDNAALARSGGPITLATTSHKWSPNEHVTTGVTIHHFRQVTSAQFTLQWDPTVLRYQSVDEFGLAGMSSANFGVASTGDGRLTFSWDDPQALGVTAADGTVLFTVRFEAIGSPGSITSLALTDEITATEVGVDCEAVPIRTQNGQVQILEVAPMRLTRVVLAHGAFRLSVPTVQGRSYTLEFTDTIAGTNWKALPPFTGDGTIKTLTDPATAQQRFYRVRVD